jgi:hypothetical protein
MLDSESPNYRRAAKNASRQVAKKVLYKTIQIGYAYSCDLSASFFENSSFLYRPAALRSFRAPSSSGGRGNVPDLRVSILSRQLSQDPEFCRQNAPQTFPLATKSTKLGRC